MGGYSNLFLLGKEFLQETIDRFILSNSIIPGFTLPTGVTILTAGIVAKELGGMTFFQALAFSMKNPNFALGNATFFSLTALVNNILMSIAFEFGIIIGSGISAGVCRKV